MPLYEGVEVCRQEPEDERQSVDPVVDPWRSVKKGCRRDEHLRGQCGEDPQIETRWLQLHLQVRREPCTAQVERFQLSRGPWRRLMAYMEMPEGKRAPPSNLLPKGPVFARGDGS